MAYKLLSDEKLNKFTKDLEGVKQRQLEKLCANNQGEKLVEALLDLFEGRDFHTMTSKENELYKLLTLIGLVHAPEGFITRKAK